MRRARPETDSPPNLVADLHRSFVPAEERAVAGRAEGFWVLPSGRDGAKAEKALGKAW
jgi:hypothetical protein